MSMVRCAKCGRSIFVALTTREIESGEIARRLCPGRCLGQGSPLAEIAEEKRKARRAEGLPEDRPEGEIRARFWRIDRELGEEIRETARERKKRLIEMGREPSWQEQDAARNAAKAKGPSFKPKLPLIERIEEAELRAGLAEYRAMEASASVLAKRWDCRPEDIYQLDLELKEKKVQGAIPAATLERARSMRTDGASLREIESATNISLSTLSKLLRDGLLTRLPDSSEDDGFASTPEKEGLKIESEPSDCAESAAEETEAEEADLDELAEIMRGGPEESELWSLAHKLRNEGASQSAIQRETGFSRGKVRRRLWPSKPRPPTTPVSVDQLRRRLVSDIDRLQNALRAVDVLLEGWTDTKEPDPALVSAAAAVLRSIGIRHA